MSTGVTAFLRLMAGRIGSAWRLPASDMVLRYVLLLSICLSGFVPQGFMRLANEDGIKLVLCTTEGPSEVWLTPGGQLLDERPADHPLQNSSTCLAVTLSLIMVQSWQAEIAVSAQFAAFRPDIVDRRSALLSPKTPQQPRAPPVLT